MIDVRQEIAEVRRVALACSEEGDTVAVRNEYIPQCGGQLCDMVADEKQRQSERSNGRECRLKTACEPWRFKQMKELIHREEIPAMHAVPARVGRLEK